MVKNNAWIPPIVWLKMTDYMHAWLQYELGSSLMVQHQKLISVQHLDGAREVLRMKTMEDTLSNKPANNSMSSMLRNCIEAGMQLDPMTTTELFGITQEQLKLYIPIECPKMCLTRHGVLRPWNGYVNMGMQQANAMQRLLREEFWKAVTAFSAEYHKSRCGVKYAQVEMIEQFCKVTGTPDMYVEAMRHEWQRRCRRDDGRGKMDDGRWKRDDGKGTTS